MLYQLLDWPAQEILDMKAALTHHASCVWAYYDFLDVKPQTPSNRHSAWQATTNKFQQKGQAEAENYAYRSKCASYTSHAERVELRKSSSQPMAKVAIIEIIHIDLMPTHLLCNMPCHLRCLKQPICLQILCHVHASILLSINAISCYLHWSSRPFISVINHHR